MSRIRVIAGEARGHKLLQVPGDKTRPITDKVKEALFNILRQDLPGSAFLDLFAGTGSVGIEALSQGAEYALFIDSQSVAVDTIRSNLQSTRLGDKAQILPLDAFAYLSRKPDRSFDYAFIAPPQYKKMWSRALYALDQNSNWLKEDAWVIVQVDPEEFEEIELDNLLEFDQRRYGNTLLVFYEHRDKKN
jgi:16S rRNA (guanine(966)-N(2))-methyltransferase RsmD